jgi:hypothetical protein
VTHYDRVLNEALRAEAELASALERLEIETAHRKACEVQVGLMRLSINAAHKILDGVPFLSNRNVSHMGLPLRVRKIVDAWRRERQPDLIRGLKPTYWFHDEVQK